ncbi:hypothetical protein J4E91_011033 [Alternaria rosae]|nr:hypothetical protein J4E91_011033 [Alternaria rosae]
MKGLIRRYWGDYQMNGAEPQPLDPSDARLHLIYNYSTADDRFAPDGQGVDAQCDAEEWMTYFLDRCQEACITSEAPDWRPGYRALFQFEFEEERFCSVCDTPIPRVSSDPASSFKQPSIGFINCPIDRASPGTVADAINAQLVEYPTGGAGIRRDCPKCGPDQLLTRRFRVEAAPEYMLVKFNPTYDDTPSPKPGSKVPPPPVMRKITNKAELPGIDEELDLTHCQVNSTTKLEYRLVAVLPHSGEFTEETEKSADPELQQAIRQAEDIRHSTAEAFDNCCVVLKANLGRIEKVNSSLARLTFKKQDWWKGHNLFSRELPPDFIEKHLAIHNGKLQNVASYVHQLEKSSYDELEVLQSKSYSSKSKISFVSRITAEFGRVFNETGHGYQHLFHFGLAIIVDVLLALPRWVLSRATEPKERQIHYDFRDVLKRWVKKHCIRRT